MADKQGNQIKITIFGQEYSVKAPADPTYIKKIAEYVDTKMREVLQLFTLSNVLSGLIPKSIMEINERRNKREKR